jgi:hypothetical protein
VSFLERKTGFEPATLILARLFAFIDGVPASPLNWPLGYGTSTESARTHPVVERSTTRSGPSQTLAQLGQSFGIAEVRRNRVSQTGNRVPCPSPGSDMGTRTTESIRASGRSARVHCRIGDQQRKQLQRNIPDAHGAKRSHVTFGPMTIGNLPVTLESSSALRVRRGG